MAAHYENRPVRPYAARDRAKVEVAVLRPPLAQQRLELWKDGLLRIVVERASGRNARQCQSAGSPST